MTVKRSIATKITNAINVAFKKIGHANGTSLPPAPKQKNTEPLVWDYHVASQLLRVAEARKKEALAELIKAGVVTDTDKFPSKPGTNETVFVGTAVSLSLSVKNGSLRVDNDKFKQELVLRGVAVEVIDEARIKASAMTKAPHQYSTTLLTSDD